MPLAITPVNATFWLAVMVLIAAVFLSVIAVLRPGDDSKHLFPIVGVMLGLFGAGGLGSLFANQAANEAAHKAVPEAAKTAVKVTEETEESKKSHKGSSKQNGHTKKGP